MYRHSHLRRFTYRDTVPHHAYKNPKEKKGLPFVAGESLSHDRQRGRAWFRPPTWPANPLRHPSSGRAGPASPSLKTPSHVMFIFKFQYVPKQLETRMDERGMKMEVRIVFEPQNGPF